MQSKQTYLELITELYLDLLEFIPLSTGHFFELRFLALKLSSDPFLTEFRIKSHST